MPDARLPKKVLYEELEEIALKVAQRNARTSLKDFENQWVLGNRLHRSDQSGEVSSTKNQLSMKKKSEAERKRRESKAKTKRSSAGSMTLTCSTCNRQFRARIGLVSHQEIMMVFLISERRMTIG